MSEPGRPEDDAHGSRLIEAVKRLAEIAEGEHGEDVKAAPSTLPREPRGFAEGVRAHAAYRRRMTPEMGEMWELGEYIEDAHADDDGAVHLGGAAPRPIKFPAWFHAWFNRQSQRTLRLLDRIIAWLDAHGEEEAERRLADLDEMVELHRARQNARRRWMGRLKWTAKFGAPVAGTVWWLIVWLHDKIPRLIEQLPVLNMVWKAIMGPT